MTVTGGLVYPLVPDLAVERNAPTGTSQAVDWARGRVQVLDITDASGNVAVAFTNPRDGETYRLIVVRDGAGIDVAFWPTNIRWPTGAAPTLSTSNNGDVYDLVEFVYDAATDLYFAPAFDATPYLRVDGQSQLTADWIVGGHDITAIRALGVDGDGTFGGSAYAFTHPAVVVTVGSSATGGAPVLRLLKDDEKSSILAFRNEAVDRWRIVNDTSENLLVSRYSSVGSLSDSTTFSASTGAVGFPADVTIGSDLGLDSADPTVRMGDGTSTPNFSFAKSDAGNASAFEFRVGGQSASNLRWAWHFAGNEDLGLRRYNGSGSLLDTVLLADWTKGDITIGNDLYVTSDVLCTSPNSSDIGNSTNYWRRAHFAVYALRVGVTTPSSLSGYAQQYVDSGDGCQKTVFADGAVATVAPGLTCQSVVVIDRDNTAASVTNTTTMTAVYSASVPAKSMGANGIVRVTIMGQYTNNTAGAATLVVRTRFGGTTSYQDTTLALAASAAPRGVRLVYEIVNTNATNSQVHGGTIVIGSTGAVTTGISGDLASAAPAVATAIVGATTALDTSAARTVEVAVQHSVASASIGFVKLYAFVELMPT